MLEYQLFVPSGYLGSCPTQSIRLIEPFSWYLTLQFKITSYLTTPLE